MGPVQFEFPPGIRFPPSLAIPPGALILHQRAGILPPTHVLPLPSAAGGLMPRAAMAPPGVQGPVMVNGQVQFDHATRGLPELDRRYFYGAAHAPHQPAPAPVAGPPAHLHQHTLHQGAATHAAVPPPHISPPTHLQHSLQPARAAARPVQRWGFGAASDVEYLHEGDLQGEGLSPGVAFGMGAAVPAAALPPPGLASNFRGHMVEFDAATRALRPSGTRHYYGAAGDHMAVPAAPGAAATALPPGALPPLHDAWPASMVGIPPAALPPPGVTSKLQANGLVDFDGATSQLSPYGNRIYLGAAGDVGMGGPHPAQAHVSVPAGYRLQSPPPPYAPVSRTGVQHHGLLG